MHGMLDQYTIIIDMLEFFYYINRRVQDIGAGKFTLIRSLVIAF